MQHGLSFHVGDYTGIASTSYLGTCEIFMATWISLVSLFSDTLFSSRATGLPCKENRQFKVIIKLYIFYYFMLILYVVAPGFMNSIMPEESRAAVLHPSDSL